MRASLFLASIPLLFAAGCDRPADPAPATPPAPASEPATPAPGVRSEPMTGTAPTGTPMAGDASTTATATVMLEPTEGNTANGALTLRIANGALHVSGHVDGLQANAEHGFHIHQNGDCSAPDASSAGDHFAVAGQPHGRVGTGEHHAGDMPNLRADGDGHAMVDIRLEGLELGGGGERDVIDRAVVIHQNPDDYVSQPAGNSGARIACGVIRMGTAADAPMIPPGEPVPSADAPATPPPPPQQ